MARLNVFFGSNGLFVIFFLRKMKHEKPEKKNIGLVSYGLLVMDDEIFVKSDIGEDEDFGVRMNQSRQNKNLDSLRACPFDETLRSKEIFTFSIRSQFDSRYSTRLVFKFFNIF
ncbi:hypothetical protein NE237_013801 [Protea cynaroides]|uniref:Uncharacterized protein n=1 Tax=Protea cynaroides TaxID=273540 RepID=A0A9Q0K0H7_9MAGN|nr:hypothetical protein NE237_013801 [Protea cynaroides]